MKKGMSYLKMLLSGLSLCLGMTASAEPLVVTNLLQGLDGATLIQKGKSTFVGRLELVELDASGNGAEFLAHFIVTGRPYVCKFSLLQSDKYVSGRGTACRYADNGQKNPTECNVFVELSGPGLKGKSYCNVLGYDIELVPALPALVGVK